MRISDWSSDVCSSDLPERGRLWRGASRLIADVLESLDQERLGGMVKGALAGRLREINVAPALGRALKAAMKEDRHVPLLDAGLRCANALLERNEVLNRAMVHERSGSILSCTDRDSIDEGNVV